MGDHLDDLLRHRAHQAFAEIEQTASRGAGSRRRSRRLAPLGAALVLASVVAVVGGTTVGLRSARLTSGTSNGAPQPSWTLAPNRSPGPPTPTATPLLPPSPPPAGIALFWVTDPAPSDTPTMRLRAYDWQGALRGWIDVPRTGGGKPSFAPSPDGSYILDGTQLLDRSGRHVGVVAPPGSSELHWEDDSVHLCSLSNAVDTTYPATSPSPTVLYEHSVGGGTRMVASMPGDLPGDSGWGLAACSHRTDRAVVIHTVCCAANEVRIYRLSTGELLADRTFADGPMVGPVTPDCRFAVSNTGGVVALVDTLTWKTVKVLHDTPTAFSWDGSSMGSGTWGAAFSVVRIADLVVLHTFGGGVRGMILATRPASGDVLVGYDLGAARDSMFPTDSGLTVVIVRADGSTKAVASGVTAL